MQSIERIVSAVEEALRRDPDDWAAAGTAAEQAYEGWYREAPALVECFSGDGRTVSAGLLDWEPVRLTVDHAGEVWVEQIEFPRLDLKGQWEVRFVDPDTGDCDAETFADLADAKLAAAIRRAQGFDPVEVRDLAGVVPADAWDRDALTHRRDA